MTGSYFSGLSDKWTQVSSTLPGLMVIYALFQQLVPECIFTLLESLSQKIIDYFNTDVQIVFPELTAEGRNKRSQLYFSIELYLSSLAAIHAKRLKAYMSKKSKNPVLSMDDYEEVKDEFLGVQVKWVSSKKENKGTSIALYNPAPTEARFYKLIFPMSHREKFTDSYLRHVMEKAKQISAKNKQRKLYTNSDCIWNDVIFEHPAIFGTLAMDCKKKDNIINDLKTFSLSKDYYAKIGKAWKRGYLLYGPPGTGKSTMIACMANYLGYDVYDLELTAVKSNSELRELMIEVSSKSIIVIEDIDCSLQLTGQRNKKKKEKGKNNEKDSTKDKEDEDDNGKVTLSGLLNSIDGLWSGCGSEKIIIFTTNHLEDSDPALIRRGRMDKHIEMSYCGFEAFKVLAKNYHDIESHCLFDEIRMLLEKVNMTPADVAENLIAKSSEDNVDRCLMNLIEALRLAKGEDNAKAYNANQGGGKGETRRMKGVRRNNGKQMNTFTREKATLAQKQHKRTIVATKRKRSDEAAPAA